MTFCWTDPANAQSGAAAPAEFGRGPVHLRGRRGRDAHRHSDTKSRGGADNVGLVLATVSGPRFQFGGEAFEGQADDVGIGTGDLFDEQIAFILDCVAARFVERINAVEIAPDIYGIEWPERHGGAFGEDSLAMITQMQEAQARDHLMGAALELFEHQIGVFEIRWLAE